nr:immunoglobulin heavy chain junction region [Mus musculus]
CTGDGYYPYYFDYW